MIEIQDKCPKCSRPREHYPIGSSGATSAEWYWTSPSGGIVCTTCYELETGQLPRGLKELNEARKTTAGTTRKRV